MLNSKLNLKSDSRGAIMVLGIVFGALLVGALWHVASIGDAIIWRERAQDAVDAGAFENAVWHARGMNAIVAINIVMSLVLAILVLWRMVLLLVTIALVLGALLCVFTLGLGCGFTATVAKVEQFMVQRDPALARNIMRVLAGMNVAEVAVATATPVLALARANQNTSSAYAGHSATTQSASLLPSINWKGIQTMQRCLQGLGKSPAKMPDKTTHTSRAGRAGDFYRDFMNQPRMGIGVSLPVQNDSFGKLCELAGEFGLNQLGGFLERASAPGPLIEAVEKARNVAGFVTGSLPGFFCSPIGGEVPQNIQELFGKHAVDACKAELDGRKQFEVGPGGPSETEEKYRTDDGRLLTADEYTKECAEEKKKEGNDKLKKNFASGTEDYDLTECGTPAKVWEWATNGNYFMRSFGQVSKGAPMLSRDDKGLEIADGDATGNVLPAEVPDEITAHAETYFDCADPWRECKGDAMWSLRWRARLRRVQPLDKLLSTAIEPAIVSTLTAMLNESGNKFADNANRKSDDETHIPHILVPKVKDTWIYRNVKNEGQKAAYESNFFSGPGQFVIDNASGDSLVH